MTLFKPAISYRLSVSEPPSSRASFPGEREAEAALLPSGLDAPGKGTDLGHLGQQPWVGLDPSLLGAREPAPLGGRFLGAARHFSSQGSGQALGPPGRLHLEAPGLPSRGHASLSAKGAVSPAHQAPGPWGSRAWGCPYGGRCKGSSGWGADHGPRLPPSLKSSTSMTSPCVIQLR